MGWQNIGWSFSSTRSIGVAGKAEARATAFTRSLFCLFEHRGLPKTPSIIPPDPPQVTRANPHLHTHSVASNTARSPWPAKWRRGERAHRRHWDVAELREDAPARRRYCTGISMPRAMYQTDRAGGHESACHGTSRVPELYSVWDRCLTVYSIYIYNRLHAACHVYVCRWEMYVDNPLCDVVLVNTAHECSRPT